ncbi:MAG: hypothetical protein ABR529_06310 [Actinomycetota bacterium]
MSSFFMPDRRRALVAVPVLTIALLSWQGVALAEEPSVAPDVVDTVGAEVQTVPEPEGADSVSVPEDAASEAAAGSGAVVPEAAGALDPTEPSESAEQAAAPVTETLGSQEAASDEAAAPVQEAAEETARVATDTIAAAEETVKVASDAIQETSDEATGTAVAAGTTEEAARVASHATDAAAETVRAASDATDAAEETVKVASDAIQETSDEATGTAGAAGDTLGSSVPEASDVEHRIADETVEVIATVERSAGEAAPPVGATVEPTVRGTATSPTQPAADHLASVRSASGAEYAGAPTSEVAQAVSDGAGGNSPAPMQEVPLPNETAHTSMLGSSVQAEMYLSAWLTPSGMEELDPIRSGVEELDPIRSGVEDGSAAPWVTGGSVGPADSSSGGSSSVAAAATQSGLSEPTGSGSTTSTGRDAGTTQTAAAFVRRDLLEPVRMLVPEAQMAPATAGTDELQDPFFGWSPGWLPFTGAVLLVPLLGAALLLMSSGGVLQRFGRRVQLG